MRKIASVFLGLATLGYIAMAIVQFMAIYTFFRNYWGWSFIFAAPVTLFIDCIPFGGTISGTIAAHKVWGWDLTQSILLFFWPYALYLPSLFIRAKTTATNKPQSKKAS